MNNPESNKPFKPKQALSPTPQLYDALVADSMENLAKTTVAELATKHPILPGSVLLDLGSGTGAGTSAIVSAVSKDVASNIAIKGIDNNEAVLAVYNQKVNDNGWPAEAVLADANNMNTFEDGTFTHSLATAMVFVLPENAVPAIREMHRTLKPGAVAVLNCWAYVPNMGPLRVASRATRPEGFPDIRGGMDQWSV
jgi:ubiquinone/menaquinone biosynthesis C-methylase UbiE